MLYSFLSLSFHPLLFYDILSVGNVNIFESMLHANILFVWTTAVSVNHLKKLLYKIYIINFNTDQNPFQNTFQ